MHSNRTSGDCPVDNERIWSCQVFLSTENDDDDEKHNTMRNVYSTGIPSCSHNKESQNRAQFACQEWSWGRVMENPKHSSDSTVVLIGLCHIFLHCVFCQHAAALLLFKKSFAKFRREEAKPPWWWLLGTFVSFQSWTVILQKVFAIQAFCWWRTCESETHIYAKIYSG